MARMKTFFLYFLGIVGFFFLSLLLEDALIENMYEKMAGEVASSNSKTKKPDNGMHQPIGSGYSDVYQR